VRRCRGKPTVVRTATCKSENSALEAPPTVRSWSTTEFGSVSPLLLCDTRANFDFCGSEDGCRLRGRPDRVRWLVQLAVSLGHVYRHREIVARSVAVAFAVMASWMRRRELSIRRDQMMGFGNFTRVHTYGQAAGTKVEYSEVRKHCSHFIEIGA
jgi:hypothetical protein